MKSHALATLMILCGGATGALAGDKAMFCKAVQKDLFAPETFSVVIKQDKVAYLNDTNALFINYRVKFERGPEVMSEGYADNGEVMFQLYNNNNKEIVMTFSGGAKGRYACSATAI